MEIKVEGFQGVESALVVAKILNWRSRRRRKWSVANTAVENGGLQGDGSGVLQSNRSVRLLGENVEGCKDMKMEHCKEVEVEDRKEIEVKYCKEIKV